MNFYVLVMTSEYMRIEICFYFFPASISFSTCPFRGYYRFSFSFREVPDKVRCSKSEKSCHFEILGCIFFLLSLFLSPPYLRSFSSSSSFILHESRQWTWIIDFRKQAEKKKFRWGDIRVAYNVVDVLTNHYPQRAHRIFFVQPSGGLSYAIPI